MLINLTRIIFNSLSLIYFLNIFFLMFIFIYIYIAFETFELPGIYQMFYVRYKMKTEVLWGHIVTLLQEFCKCASTFRSGNFSSLFQQHNGSSTGASSLRGSGLMLRKRRPNWIDAPDDSFFLVSRETRCANQPRCLFLMASHSSKTQTCCALFTLKYTLVCSRLVSFTQART